MTGNNKERIDIKPKNKANYSTNSTNPSESNTLIKSIISAAIIILVASGLFLLYSKYNSNKSISKSGFYFDTIITITLYNSDDEELIKDCFKMADDYENLLSKNRTNSDISLINQNAGKKEVQVSDQTIEVLRKGLEYSKNTDGAFDITIGSLSDLWDISSISENINDDNNEIKDGQSDFSLPSASAVKESLSHVDYSNLIIDNNTVYLKDKDASIDLGGIAKGFIADKMKEYLNSQGVREGIINLGGNVLCLGEKKSGDYYTIGIQKPFSNTGQAIASVKVKDASVVTSGIYERYYRYKGKIYHHILSTKDGYPYDNDLYSVTIISKSSMDGDALSTSCYALGKEKAIEYIESLEYTEAIFIDSDYNITYTSGVGSVFPIEY